MGIMRNLFLSHYSNWPQGVKLAKFKSFVEGGLGISYLFKLRKHYIWSYGTGILFMVLLFGIGGRIIGTWLIPT